MANDEAMGRWASRVELSVDADGFTLDFFRIDFQRASAILVSRVTLSPRTASALVETLNLGLDEYAGSLVESTIKPLASGDDDGDNGTHGRDLHDA